MKKDISNKQKAALIETLKLRFEKNMHRHKGINWATVEGKIISQPKLALTLNNMETTGGEPDVIGIDQMDGRIIFCDCSKESPIERRSVCYDEQALASRKSAKPRDSATHMASEIGIEMLDERQYLFLQSLEQFDTKTSSWLKTPDDVRSYGGAIFGDYRYGRVFFYHNGAESYYSARGFRGIIKS